MNISIEVILSALVFSAAVAAALAYYTWRRRDVNGGTALFIMLVAISIWSTGYIFEIVSDSLIAKLFWVKIEYLGIATIPATWVVFTLRYTSRSIPRWLGIVLVVHPLSVIALSWSNNLHNLFWPSAEIITANGVEVLSLTHGWMFWIHAAFSYVLFFTSALLLVGVFLRPSKIYRGQALTLLVSFMLPWIGNVIYLSGVYTTFDLSSIAFTASAVVMVAGVYRFQLLDIVPVARENIINSLSHGVVVTSDKHLVVDINQAACNLLAVHVNDVLGKAIEEVLPGSIVPRYFKMAHLYEEIAVGDRFFDVRISPINYRRSRQQGRVVILQDITERKKNEQNLRRQALVFENISDSVIITNLNGRIIDCNQATEKLYGYGKGELLGKDSSLWQVPGTSVDITQQIQKSLDEYGRWHGELPYIHKDGAKRISESVVLPLHDNRGILVARINVSRDITERKEAEHMLRESKELAEEASRAKTTFLANMSHELRTPLTAIIGYSELIETEIGEVEPEEILKDIKNIQLAGNHLMAIIQDILDLTKIEAGQMDIFPESFIVTTFIDEVLLTVKHLAVKNNNEFIVDYADAPFEMYSDQLKVRQILMNLISNALKFTKDGTIKLTVKNQTNEDGSEIICFQVADTGIGIGEEQLQLIFEAFAQADASTTRRYGGTGLGLTITQHICHMLGGRIDVESKVNEGSSFTVHLPLRYEPEKLNVSL
ncbi:MAG: ATP-binding protein [Chloroflexi bacterium]|nr:ATP-binding protein [Chloroflexota bacterium]